MKEAEWLIETASQQWRVRARTWREAVRKAWKKRPPNSVGVLVLFAKEGAPEEETVYCMGHVALKTAGFECPAPTLAEYLAAAK